VSWRDTLRTALAAIGSHRLRSILTMLGILIGIAAVILTVGLGQGAQAQVSEQIGKLGRNLLIVTPGSSTSATGIRGGRGSASTLTARDSRALADRGVAPDIARVAPASTGSHTLIAGSTNWTTNVVGTTPDWLAVRTRTVSEGRFFTADELASAASVIVLGPDTAAELFGGRRAVGQSVTTEGTAFTVIGVLASVGSSSAANDDDTALAPMTTTATRLSTGTTRASISTIYLEAAAPEVLTAAQQEATAALLTLHGLPTAQADFTIASQQSLIETATATDRTLTILLGGVAALSLLVGGIGVMNIMLVSVTERIREIGLRKALGATPRLIRRQFLTEAGLLGLAGGVLGLGLGLAGAALLPGALGQPVTVSPVAALAAVTVAVGIGIGAGVYPAGRAARLAPIDALRSE
jgi:putative ABC transport system permease protein